MFSYTPPATAVLFDGRNAHLKQRCATAGSVRVGRSSREPSVRRLSKKRDNARPPRAHGAPPQRIKAAGAAEPVDRSAPCGNHAPRGRLRGCTRARCTCSAGGRVSGRPCCALARALGPSASCLGRLSRCPLLAAFAWPFMPHCRRRAAAAARVGRYRAMPPLSESRSSSSTEHLTSATRPTTPERSMT